MQNSKTKPFAYAQQGSKSFLGPQVQTFLAKEGQCISERLLGLQRHPSPQGVWWHLQNREIPSSKEESKR